MKNYGDSYIEIKIGYNPIKNLFAINHKVFYKEGIVETNTSTDNREMVYSDVVNLLVKETNLKVKSEFELDKNLKLMKCTLENIIQNHNKQIETIERIKQEQNR